MTHAAIWVQAVRPRTLIASLSPAILASSYAYTHGTLNIAILLLTLLTALSIQIMINLSNDYFDFIKGADTEKRKGPQRVTQAGLVSHASIKKAIFISALLASICAAPLIYTASWPIALFFILYMVLGIGYTAGPYPLAYLGLGDICVLILFGPIATAITYYLQTHTLSPEVLMGGCSVGLISSAILMANNLRDEEEDRAAHKKTLVVRCGSKRGRFIYAIELLLALVIPLFQGIFFPLLLTPCAYLLIKQAMLGKYDHVLLQRTGAFLLLYTLVYTADILFSPYIHSR